MDETLSDNDLMLRYAKGDTGSFESLYHRHKGALYRYFLRQCSTRATAEELAHDVWIKVINARERYQAKAKFTTYLFHIAHNRLIDFYRRQSVHLAASFEDENCPAVEDIGCESNNDPAVLVTTQESISHLLHQISLLPEVQREALLLHIDTGMKLSEIAAATAVSIETAKSRLRYALAKLRHALGNEP